MMDRASAADYVYAQASGKLAKSFIGNRAQQLFETNSMSELWTLVFKSAVPLIPESLLAQQLEKQAEIVFLKDFMRLLSAFSQPDEILLLLLRFYDFSNLKKINYALQNNESMLPAITDIGKYSMLHYNAFPNMELITKGSSVSWVKKAAVGAQVHEFEQQLDKQYICNLWEAAQSFPSFERAPIEKLIREEIELKNIIWALRLKVYYGMSSEEIIPYLASERKNVKKSDSLAGKALKILDKSIDSYADWEKWEYASLLNPHEEGVVWTIDPRWLQKTVNVRLNKRAMVMFHQMPCTGAALVAWFKIKQHELDFIRTAAEGLRLNVEAQKCKEFIGIN